MSLMDWKTHVRVCRTEIIVFAHYHRFGWNATLETKHPRKLFQNFRQSYTLSIDRVEIHQSQPASMTQRRSEGHTSGCHWWISIRSVDNVYDWRKFWKRFRGCFVFQSRVSTKVVVNMQICGVFVLRKIRAASAACFSQWAYSSSWLNLPVLV